MWKRGLLALVAALTLGAGKPLAISLTPSSATITEGQSVSLVLGKSGGNGRVSTAKITTSDGSWSGTVTLGARFTVPTKDDTLVNGTRTVTVTATASTGVTAKSVITVRDNDVAPPPTVTWRPCASEGQTCYVVGVANVRYGSGSTWLVRPVDSFVLCSNTIWGDPTPGVVKSCQTDGTPAAPPPPPPPPPPVLCSDGSTVPAGQTCPTPPPPPTNSWVSAPLHDDGFARVKTNPDSWDMVGPGAGRALVAGEFVAIFANGWGADYTGRVVYELIALSDGAQGRAYASDLDGIAPLGTPPQLPADWWHPGLVRANKACPGAFGGPGVTQGGVYRAEMLIGTHTSLASGQTGSAAATWTVYAADDPWQGARVVVTGDCLVGL